MSSPAYTDLRNLIKERTSDFVFWVGSGPSSVAGLPTWTELHRRVLDRISKSLADLPSSTSALGKRLGAARRADAWIAFQILEEIASRVSDRCTRRTYPPERP